MEEDLKKVRKRSVETQFVIMGDRNTRIGNLEIRLQYTWENSETNDKNSDKGYEGRNSRDSNQW
jgi:hypothetical protein